MEAVRLLKKIFEILVVILCLTVFAGGIYYYLTVSRSPKPPPKKTVDNAVVIVTTAPFQLLVILPDGKKTGFDPVVNKTFYEIPQSKYYLQPAKTGIDNGSYWLGLASLPESFVLQVVGETNQYFGFGVYVYTHNQESSETYWGKITAGNTADYQIKSSPQNNFPLEVTLIK